jgi:RimJ/RimL family protein N-acetyltransferase
MLLQKPEHSNNAPKAKRLASFPLGKAGLLLRPVSPMDTAPLHRVLGDPELGLRQPEGLSGSPAETERRVVRWQHDLRTLGYGVLAVLNAGTGEVAGAAGLLPPADQGSDVRLAFWLPDIRVPAVGETVLQTALSVCCEWAFKTAGLKRLTAICLETDEASRDALLQLGWKVENTSNGWVRLSASAPKPE